MGRPYIQNKLGMINQVEHLPRNHIVNRGSFYTPEKFIRIAAEWLKKHRLNDSYIIMDTSCGYGAFFRLQSYFPGNRYIGNDIDPVASEAAKRNFPFITVFNTNALCRVRRAMFNLDDEPVCIVGNPPYNDVTSQIGREIKTDKHETDKDIRSRDLGLSFLKSYSKLSADYVLILHPLSYLLKKTNFSSARTFFDHYKILESIVFSSHEFADTSRAGEFPIIMALYKRTPRGGLTRGTVLNYLFQTIEGHSFCMADFDYIVDYIHKYPGPTRYTPEILFYTMRDINALKRSRTFIRERCANAIDVDPAKLAYYCYVDLFKKYASAPYWMGNFDVPFNAKKFSRYTDDILALSKSLHPEVFGKQGPPPEKAEQRVKKYIRDVLNVKRKSPKPPQIATRG